MNTERDEYFSPDSGTQLEADFMSLVLDPEYGEFLDRAVPASSIGSKLGQPGRHISCSWRPR